jgi:phosphatidylinositol alpha-mannosyltransferase
VVHLHEPATPSLSLLALWAAEGPVVATYHSSNDRSRALSSVAAILRPSLEKITARIAVSEDARSSQVSHVGGEPVVIPNGLHVDRFATAEPRPAWRGEEGTVVFVGRLGEPRKGWPLLADAFGRLTVTRPGLRLLVVGGGDVEKAVAGLPAGARDQITFLGRAPDTEKQAALRSADVYVAPNTGGESFGIVLVEAMAAGATVLASDLPAFRRVLAGGRYGALFRNEDVGDLATQLQVLLDDAARRSALATAARTAVRRYDWSTVVGQVLRVYETVVGDR